MKVLDRQAPYSSFLDQVSGAHQRILLLDYDGTLAPFTAKRDQAFPYPEIPALLERIMRCGTRLVLISGRSAPEVISLIGMLPHPEVWGSHGLERIMADGSHFLGALPASAEAGLKDAFLTLQEVGLDKFLERKLGSIAAHWRGLPVEEQESLRVRVLKAWQPLLAHYPLTLLEFDGGLEIRLVSANKGDAVRCILREAEVPPVVAYLGDDCTDEDAFHALKGRGLPILVSPQPRPTAAEIWLKPPHELLDFLRQWLVACGGAA